MSVRRGIVSVAGAVLAITAGAVCVAPSAGAADHTITVDCIAGILIPRQELTVSPGDTIVLDGTSCEYRGTSESAVALFSSIPSGNSGGNVGPYTWVVDGSLALGTYGGPDLADQTFIIVANSSALCGDYYCGATYYLTVVAPSDDAVTTGATPPPWFKAYGRASQESTCDDGWSPSYAEWMNGGRGGWTCEQTESYDVGSGSWVTR